MEIVHSMNQPKKLLIIYTITTTSEENKIKDKTPVEYRNLVLMKLV
ncbi:hypothetical protein GCM10007190_10350 [Macrococcus hajekii]|nr:hypothetical protein GCM10007190_10350 [Macrococcus hajekii]